jgi:hypothetical protein
LRVRGGEPGCILRQLVEQQQHRTPVEDALQEVLARCGLGGGLGLDAAVQGFAADLERDLAPEGVGHEIDALGLVYGDLVTGDAHHPHLSAGVQTRRIEDAAVETGCGGRGQLTAPEAQVCQRDQQVGLAAAEGRFRSVQGRYAAVSVQACHDVRQHHAQAVGGEGGLGEEGFAVGVEVADCPGPAAIVIDDLGQARGEDLGVERALQQVRARRAGVEDRLHVWRPNAGESLSGAHTGWLNHLC